MDAFTSERLSLVIADLSLPATFLPETRHLPSPSQIPLSDVRHLDAFLASCVRRLSALLCPHAPAYTRRFGPTPACARLKLCFRRAPAGSLERTTILALVRDRRSLAEADAMLGVGEAVCYPAREDEEEGSEERDDWGTARRAERKTGDRLGRVAKHLGMCRRRAAQLPQARMAPDVWRIPLDDVEKLDAFLLACLRKIAALVCPTVSSWFVARFGRSAWCIHFRNEYARLPARGEKSMIVRMLAYSVFEVREASAMLGIVDDLSPDGSDLHAGEDMTEWGTCRGHVVAVSDASDESSSNGYGSDGYSRDGSDDFSDDSSDSLSDLPTESLARPRNRCNCSRC